MYAALKFTRYIYFYPKEVCETFPYAYPLAACYMNKALNLTKSHYNLSNVTGYFISD